MVFWFKPLTIDMIPIQEKIVLDKQGIMGSVIGEVVVNFFHQEKLLIF
jgi:hypothetical protein